MPELPEVETVCRGLAQAFTAKRIARVIVRRPDLRIPFPDGFGQRLTGARFEAFSRRAKYILAALSTGETLIIHLGMSGRFVIRPCASHSPHQYHKISAIEAHGGHINNTSITRHDHVVFDTEDGMQAVYCDPRRFGLMTLADTKNLAGHKFFASLGPEPLGPDFDAATLSAALRGKATPIKAALLDQHVVAGLGNIYVCEALARAGISPLRQASSVAGKRAERLVPQIRAVLREAIAAGGSTLRDFAATDGELGYFQHGFRVYDRAGAPCPTPKCRGKVRRIVQSGRSSFYCGVCQR